MEPSKKNKRDLKSILPKHEIGDELWNNIEQQLNSSNKLQELPQYTAPESLWEAISLQLPSQQGLRRRRYVRIGAYVSGIAASLILVLYLIGPIQNQEQLNQTVVIHSEEVIKDEVPVQFAVYENEKGTETIIQYCTNFPSICVNPEFVQLKSKWQNLKDQLIDLKSLSNSGKNEQVDYYITRIEMDIKQLENKMMHMFL